MSRKNEWEKLQLTIRNIRELVGDYDVLEGIQGDQHRATVRADLGILDSELMCSLPKDLKMAALIWLEVQP